MKKSILSMLLVLVFVTVILSGCGSAPNPVSSAAASPVPPTFTPSPIPPTTTPEPTSTSTPIPSPTPLPGVVVVPVDKLNTSIPWLPMENTARPGVSYLGFNTNKPPFDNPLVRQAFSAAIDRQAIADLVNQYYSEMKARPATTIIPPETLGLDLTDVVGVPYNPQHAQELLIKAGYSDPTNPDKFPEVTFFVRASGFGEYPGFPLKLAEAIAGMWRSTLSVRVVISATAETLDNRFAKNPPDIYRFPGWAADYNDPDNFLKVLFATDSDYNYGQFSNEEFDRLVLDAAGETDPAKRQQLYIEAERLITETEAAVIPLYFVTYNIP